MARKKKKKKTNPASGRKKRSRKKPPVVEPDADEPPIVDLDEDGDADDSVAALIAEAVATAPPAEEPDEREPPVIDLDAEVEVEAEGDIADANAAAATSDAAPATPVEQDLEAAAPPTADSPDAAPPGRQTPEEAIRQLIDLGPVSAPEIRDRLLAEALAHAEHKDARYRVPFSETPTAARWKALAGLWILLVAGLVALAPPGWARPDPPAQLAAAERVQSLRVALLLQAEQIEAFRVREQRLPMTLDEVAGALPGVRYVRSGTRAYQLIAYLPDASAVVYDSASPREAFEAVVPAWRPEEGAS